MAIRIELPPRILPRLRLRWHSAHALVLRQTRALREFASRTTAVPRAWRRHISDTVFARLSVRAYLARRRRARFEAFAACYEDLVDLLCWAAKDGDHTDRDARYAQLRAGMRRHYRAIRPRLRPYWAGTYAPATDDPFEALFAPKNVDDVINAAAASWDASLILVGLGRHHAIDRLFGTETAINVIKHASLPVLAVPPHTRELPRRACAAIDFSSASLAAALLAASLLAEGGKLTLLHASPYKGAEAETDPIAQLYRSAAGHRLAEILAVVRKATPHHVDGLLLDGEPAEAVLEFVGNEHCDLVALGGHPQRLIDRILIGSVRTRVLRAADCAVLVAPPASERD